MKKLTISLKMLLSVVIIIIFTTIFTAAIGPIDEPVNPYAIQIFHNVLFFAFGISFFYTIYLAGCTYMRYKKDLERAKSVNKVKDEAITPETVTELAKIFDIGLLTVILYVLQSYVYDYTFI